ncbi:MAG: efflux RND transporter periplasmic adaptor subunit [Candidatus Gastranaerophilales bacterium]
MKIKKRYLLLALSIAIVAGGFAVFTSNSEKVRYITVPLERTTLTEYVEASGTINPVNTLSVGSTVSGLIQSIYVDYNSEVKKGDLLAEIDPRLFEANVQQYQAQINDAKASLAKAIAEVNMAEKTYTRYKNLYEKNFIAKSELDQAESDYLANQALVQSAKAQIKQYEASYSNAATNLSYTKIIAPVDGTIISREVDIGQSVAASFSAPELFTIAQDLKEMQIEVDVSEADIGYVKEGQEVIYTLDGYNDQEFHGEVTQVRLSATTVSNVVTYTVIVKVQNDDFILKPGMTANVMIVVAKKVDVFAVENEALKYTPETTGQKYKTQGIWILLDKKPVRIDIETGITDGISTEIISDDIYYGDEVIIKSIIKTKKSSSALGMPKGGGPGGGGPR